MSGKAFLPVALIASLAALAAAEPMPPPRAPSSARFDSIPPFSDGRENAFVDRGEKSQATALAWSVFGTAVPLITATALSGKGNPALENTLLLSGLLVGPSLGQFYAGSTPHGLLALGIRGAGGFVGLYGIAMMIGESFCDMDSDSDTDCSEKAGPPLAVIGLFTYMAGAVYSLYDAGAGVERYNAHLNQRETFGFAPVLVPGREGSLKTGAVAWMRF
jgi:hypothetical protein